MAPGTAILTELLGTAQTKLQKGRVSRGGDSLECGPVVEIILTSRRIESNSLACLTAFTWQKKSEIAEPSSQAVAP
jgi:hypothetical protein